MENFKYHKEWEDKCRENIGWKKNCADCLFDALCLFKKNQERIQKNIEKDNSEKINKD